MRAQSSICTVLLVAAGPALAQSAVLIDIDQPTLSPGESTTVTLSAAFPVFEYAMAGLETDLLVSTGTDGWSDVSLVSPMDGPGTSAGSPAVAGFEAIIAGQLNFPCAGCGVGSDANPIVFWQSTYAAPTSVAAPFDIDLSTSTARFDVYIEIGTPEARSYLDGLVEANATIRVIPAPAGVLVIAVCPLLATHRRR